MDSTTTTPPNMVMSDLDRDRYDQLREQQQQQHDFASQLLDQFGHVLDSVDDVVTRLEDDTQILPTAILRKCTEFADMVGHVANQLEQQTDDERQQLATAIQQDLEQFETFHTQHGLEFLETTTADVGGAAGGAGATTPHPAALFSTISPASTTTDASSSSSSFATVPNLRGGNVPTDEEEQQEEEDVQVVVEQRNSDKNDILKALSGVVCLLRDVESSMRDISVMDAEELADVGLTLARLFLMSLQNLHETLTPEHVIEAAAAANTNAAADVGGGMYYYSPAAPPPSSVTKTTRRSSVVIKELSADDSFVAVTSSNIVDETTIIDDDGVDDDDDDDVVVMDWSSRNSIRQDLDLDLGEVSSGSNSRRSRNTTTTTAKSTFDNAAAATAGTTSKTETTRRPSRRRSSSCNNNNNNNNNNRRRRNNKKKVRCLWPPLGPHVSNMMDWTKDEVIKKHPILTVALGLTLWPVAVTTAVVGTGALIVDNAVQDLYNHFSDGPILSNLEQGAAQLYQTGRLGYVTSKLVTRQTVRVVSRQIERQGGIGPVLDNVKSNIVERIVHPVETAGMLWDGINVCVGFVTETVGHVIAMKQEESNQTVQELQAS